MFFIFRLISCFFLLQKTKSLFTECKDISEAQNNSMKSKNDQSTSTSTDEKSQNTLKKNFSYKISNIYSDLIYFLINKKKPIIKNDRIIEDLQPLVIAKNNPIKKDENFFNNKKK